MQERVFAMEDLQELFQFRDGRLGFLARECVRADHENQMLLVREQAAEMILVHESDEPIDGTTTDRLDVSFDGFTGYGRRLADMMQERIADQKHLK